MSRRQNVTVDCSNCGSQTDVEYLVCTSCLDDLKSQLDAQKEESVEQHTEIEKLEAELESIDERYKYYKDLVENCTTCTAKHTVNNL